MRESLAYSVHHEESFSLLWQRKENVAGCSLIWASQVTASLFFFFNSVCVDLGIVVLWSCFKSAFKEGTNTYLRSSIFDLLPSDIDKNSSEAHRIVVEKMVTWITVLGIVSLNKLTLSPYLFLPSTHGHTSELAALSWPICIELSCLNTQLVWYFSQNICPFEPVSSQLVHIISKQRMWSFVQQKPLALRVGWNVGLKSSL